MPAFVRLELWSQLQCQGGTRLGFLGRIDTAQDASAIFAVASDESFTVTLPADDCDRLSMQPGQVLRVVFSDGSFDEWRISKTAASRPSWAITCSSVLIDLVDDELFVDAAVNGFPVFASGMAGATASEALDALIADRAARGASIPLFRGQVDCAAVLPNIQWDTAGTVARARAIQQAVLQTGEPCELRAYPNGVLGYYLDLVDEIGGSAALLLLRLGKHLTGDAIATTDRTDQATVVIIRGGDLAGFATGIGLSRWAVSGIAGSVASLQDPAGGKGPIGADGQFVDGALYRETDGTLLEITASSFANQTVTLSSVGSLTVGDIVQFRTTSDSATAKPPVELPYPSRIATYGRKVGNFKRSAVIGVPNMAPNAVMRLWGNLTKLPDGYTFGTVFHTLGPFSDTPDIHSVTFSRNTDPLFRQVGSQNLHVVVNQGIFVTPPLKFVPWYDGMPLSLRIRILLASGWDARTTPASIITMWLGILLADGTLKQWYDPTRIAQFKPSGSTARPSPPYKDLPGAVWNDLLLDGNDITAPSAAGVFAGVTSADIDALATDALGIVALLELQTQTLTGGTFTPIEAYIDSVMLAPSLQSPPGMSEFGGSNTLHQTGNLVLGEMSVPALEVSASALDLERDNPGAFSAERLRLGGRMQLVDPVVPAEPLRATKIQPIYQRPKDTKIEFASRRRLFTELLVGAPDNSVQLGGATSTGALGSVASGTGSAGSGPGGSLPSVTVRVSLDSSFVPSFVASVGSTVIKIFYAWSTSGPPTIADILAGTEIDAPTAFSGTHAAISDGDTIYIGVIAKDAVGNVSSPAHDQALASSPEPGTLNPAIPLLNIGTDAGDWQARARYDIDNSMEYVRGGSTRNGGDCWRTAHNASVAGTMAVQKADVSKCVFIDLAGKTIPGDGMLIIQWMDNVSFTPSLFFWLDSSRVLRASRTDGAGDVALPGCVASFALAPNALGWLETVGRINGGAGAAIAYWTPLGGARVKLFDERTLNTVSDANTTGTGVGVYVLGPSAWTSTTGTSNGPAGVLMDDEHFYNRTGVSLDDVSGRPTVETLFPAAAGHYADVLGAFDDFNAEEQEGDFGPSEFVADDQRLSFKLAAVSSGVGQVNAAVPFYATRQLDRTGSPIGRVAIRSGSTDAESADIALAGFVVAGGHYYGFNVDGGTGKLNPRFGAYVDPNTSAAWTLANWANADVVWRQRVASNGGLLCQLGVDVSCYPAGFTHGPAGARGSRVIPYRVIGGASLDSGATQANELYRRLNSVLTIPAACATASGTPLSPGATYANGSSGVGATLTGTATGVLTVDGHTVALNDYVLVKDQVGAGTPEQNGLYKCTTAGAVGVHYVLTRAVEMDEPAEFPHLAVWVSGGTTNGGRGFWCSNTSAPTIGTTSIGFVGLDTPKLGAGSLLGTGGGTDGARHGALRGSTGDIDIQIAVRGPANNAFYASAGNGFVDSDDYPYLANVQSVGNAIEVYQAVWANLNSSSIATELGQLRIFASLGGAEQVRLSLNSSRQFVATRRDTTPVTLQTSTATAPSTGRYGIAWRVRINPSDSTGADSYIKVWLTTSGPTTRTLIIDTEGTGKPLRANGFGNTVGAIGFFGIYGTSTDGAAATFSDPVWANPGTTSSSTPLLNGRWANLQPAAAGSFQDSSTHDPAKVADSDFSAPGTPDGSYNVLTASGKKDSFTVNALPIDAVGRAILALLPYAYVSLPHSPSGSGETFRPIMLLNGTLLRGPKYKVTQPWKEGRSLVYSRFTKTKNPVTAAAPTVSEVNAMEIGGELVTHASDDVWVGQLGADVFYEWTI